MKSFKKNIKVNIMKKLEMKNFNTNTTLMEKQQKYQYYDQGKLINENLLHVEKHDLLINFK